MRKQWITVTATVFTILVVSSMAPAADLTWDVVASGTGTITDGPGNWQDGAANWNNLTTDVNWNNATPDNATFGGSGGAAGTVTVVGGVTVGDITFNAPSSGSYTIDASTVTLSGTPTITANVGATISSVLAGTGFTKAGAGTLTLSGANTYAGTTTINAGTLEYGAGHVILAGAVTISGGTLDIVTYSDTVGAVTLTGGEIAGTSGVLTGTATYDMQAGTVSAILGGGQALTKTTAGTVILSGANTYTGLTTINAGTLSIGAATGVGTAAGGVTFSGASELDFTGAFTLAETIDLDAAGTFDTNANAVTLSGVIDGASTLTKTGSGTLTLTGTNTYDGLTSINGGTVSAGAIANLGDAGVGLAFNAGTLNLTGAITLTDAIALNGAGTIDSDVANTLSGIISGVGALTKTGAGTLTLTGTNIYDGLTSINGGTVSVVSIANLGDVGTGLAFNAGTLNLTGAIDLTDNIALNGAGTIDSNVSNTLSGIISGVGALTKTGTGTLTLTGVNTYDGVTNIDGGTVSVAAVNNLGDAGVGLTFNNGTLNFTGAITLTDGITLDAGGGTIDSDVANTLSGIIAGAAGGALTKTGAGTLTLSGTNTYDGVTIMNGGTLSVGAVANLGDAGTGLLFSAGTLNLTGAIDLTDNIALNGDGTIDSDVANTLSGVITGVGALTKTGDGTLTLTGANIYDGLTSMNGGTVSVGAIANLGDAGTGLAFNNGTLNLTGAITLTDNIALNGAGTIDSDVANTLSGIISGVGALTKTGTGTLTLTGTNTYDGVTSINGGTLSAGAIVNLGDAGTGLALNAGTLNLTGAINLTDNIALNGVGGTIDSDVANTLSGIISGVGALTKTGTGTLTLTGTNIYDGLTSINGGTVSVVSIANLGDVGTGLAFNAGTLNFTGAIDLTDNIALNGAGTIDSNVANTLSGIISGVGALTKTGTGTLTLSGVNTYDGLTSINGGTLSVGAIANLGDAGVGLAFNNGTLNLTGAIDLTDNIALNGAGTIDSDVANTLSGIISGVGALTKTGTGTLTLSGVNTYDGLTSINGGTLSVGAINNLGDAGVGLAFNAGTLTLTSAIDLTDAVAMNAGGGTINSALNHTFSGVFTSVGGGDLTKTGAGRLTLTNAGSGAFAGDTALNGGTLWINGTLGGGTLTVAGGTTLGGTGTYDGNVVVNNLGTVGPGNSIGELTVANYNPAAGSILNVEVDLPTVGPPAADLLTVTAAAAGAATIAAGATVDIDLLTNINLWPAGVNTYNIVRTTGAGGTVVGTFDALAAPATPADTAIFQHTLTYTATTVNYVLTRQTIQNLALTSNQTAVGTALQARIGDAGDMLNNVAPVINGYALASQVRTALNQISPASLDVSTGATLDNARRFQDGLTEQLRRYHVPGAGAGSGGVGTTVKADDDDMPLLAFGGNNDNVLALMMEAREQNRADRAEISEGPLRFWVRQFNNWSNEDAENDIPGYDNFTTGVAIGGDVKVGDNLAVGVAIGYSNTDIDLTGGFGEGEIDTLRGSIYATWFKDGAYADAALGFGNNWYENTRNIAFMGRKATSDHTGQEYSAYIGGGYDFLFFGGYVGPTVSVQYTGLSEESYNESGAGALNQNIDSRDSHSLQTAVGLRYLHPIKLSDEKTTLVPEVRAKWLHEFMNDRDVSARFSGGGAAYTVDGNSVEKNSALLGGRLTAYLNDSVSLYADYELQLQGSGGQTGHTVSAGLRIAW